MYKAFIKEWLLENQSRVYSVIVSTYADKIKDLKPTLFIKWLSKEIDIPVEKINLSSLNSALTRQKKKEAKNKILLPSRVDANKSESNENFTFSDVDKVVPKSRITEF
jgi:GTP-binding protein EngB required for normal cell division